MNRPFKRVVGFVVLLTFIGTNSFFPEGRGLAYSSMTGAPSPSLLRPESAQDVTAVRTIFTRYAQDYYVHDYSGREIPQSGRHQRVNPRPSASAVHASPSDLMWAGEQLTVTSRMAAELRGNSVSREANLALPAGRQVSRLSDASRFTNDASRNRAELRSKPDGFDTPLGSGRSELRRLVQQGNKLLDGKRRVSDEGSEGAGFQKSVVGNGQNGTGSFFFKDDVRSPLAHDPSGFLERLHSFWAGYIGRQFRHGEMESKSSLGGNAEQAAGAVTQLFSFRALIQYIEAITDRFFDILAHFRERFPLADAAGKSGALGDVAARIVGIYYNIEFHRETPINLRGLGDLFSVLRHNLIASLILFSKSGIVLACVWQPLSDGTLAISNSSSSSSIRTRKPKTRIWSPREKGSMVIGQSQAWLRALRPELRLPADKGEADEAEVGKFVRLLEGLLAGGDDSGAVHVTLRTGMEAWINKEKAEANRAKVIAGVLALREALLSAGQRFEDGLPYVQISGVPDFHLEQRSSLILMAVGKVLGLWDVFPNPDGREAQALYQLDAGVSQFPLVVSVNRAALGIEPPTSGPSPRAELRGNSVSREANLALPAGRQVSRRTNDASRFTNDASRNRAELRAAARAE